MKKPVILSAFVSLLLSACSVNPAPNQAEREQIGIETQAVAGDRVVDSYGRTNVFGTPPGLVYTKVEVGTLSTFALRSDGEILARGADDYCQQRVPALPTGLRYTDLSARGLSMLALRSDGQVVAWGNDLCRHGIPEPLPLPKDNRFIAVAVGGYHGLALRNDGTIRAWGSNVAGELDVPPLPAGLGYTAVDAGSFYSLALRSDGQVIAWGGVVANPSVPQLPTGLSYIAISVGHGHCLALRSDGQVIGWGDNARGQLNVPALPEGLTYTAVAAGSRFSKAVRSDGEVVQWGVEEFGDGLLPVLPLGSKYLAVSGDIYHSAALVVAPPVRTLHNYNIDFETLLGKPPVSSVQVGRGVVYVGKGTGNTQPIAVEGRSGSSKMNRAMIVGTTRSVVGTTGNKVLTVAGEDGRTSSATGGALGLSFAPSFNSRGVTVNSLKFTGSAFGAVVKVVAFDGRSRTVRVSPLKTPQTITLDAALVKTLEVSSPGPFAIDDILFGE